MAGFYQRRRFFLSAHLKRLGSPSTRLSASVLARPGPHLDFKSSCTSVEVVKLGGNGSRHCHPVKLSQIGSLKACLSYHTLNPLSSGCGNDFSTSLPTLPCHHYTRQVLLCQVALVTTFPLPITCYNPQLAV